MLIKLRKRTAQSTLEYVVLAVVVIGALLSIQAYLRRGIAGKIKSSTDDISAEQYDPLLTTYNKTTTTKAKTIDQTAWNGTFGETLYENVTGNAESAIDTSQ
jgi:hypothetical protein